MTVGMAELQDKAERLEVANQQLQQLAELRGEQLQRQTILLLEMERLELANRQLQHEADQGRVQQLELQGSVDRMELANRQLQLVADQRGGQLQEQTNQLIALINDAEMERDELPESLRTVVDGNIGLLAVTGWSPRGLLTAKRSRTESVQPERGRASEAEESSMGTKQQQVQPTRPSSTTMAETTPMPLIGTRPSSAQPIQPVQSTKLVQPMVSVSLSSTVASTEMARRSKSAANSDDGSDDHRHSDSSWSVPVPEGRDRDDLEEVQRQIEELFDEASRETKTQWELRAKVEDLLRGLSRQALDWYCEEQSMSTDEWEDSYDDLIERLVGRIQINHLSDDDDYDDYDDVQSPQMVALVYDRPVPESSKEFWKLPSSTWAPNQNSSGGPSLVAETTKKTASRKGAGAKAKSNARQQHWSNLPFPKQQQNGEWKPTVPLLREELRLLGLDTSGVKRVLIERLNSANAAMKERLNSENAAIKAHGQQAVSGGRIKMPVYGTVPYDYSAK